MSNLPNKEKIKAKWFLQIEQMIGEKIMPAMMIGVTQDGCPCMFTGLNKAARTQFLRTLLDEELKESEN